MLDYEPRASESVTCLLEFQEYSKALVQALKSYDTDLVYQVLHQIVVDQLSENDRFRIISSRNNSVASDVFLSYCKDENRYEMITHFLKMCNKRNEAGKNTILDFIQIVGKGCLFEETYRWSLLFRTLSWGDQTKRRRIYSVQQKLLREIRCINLRIQSSRSK